MPTRANPIALLYKQFRQSFSPHLTRCSLKPHCHIIVRPKLGSKGIEPKPSSNQKAIAPSWNFRLWRSL
ncbi:MAG: hypothetical protein RMY34_19250 [Aulosira sp. DedQUE10]|nr:hypothetical protein [Aulosira sp. DedQUE10]